MAIEVPNASGWGSDIQAEAPVSSVGAVVWPPVEASEQRRKGILNRVLEEPQDFAETVSGFSRQEFGSTRTGEPVTRISGRVFAANAALESLDSGQSRRMRPYVESVIPLAGTGVPELEDVSMIYLGRNSEERRTDPAVLRAEIDMARETFSRTPAAISRAYEGYDFRILTDADRNDANLQSEYAGLYSAFGWEESDVVKMLTNPGNTLMAVFGNAPGQPRGTLASAVIAEHAVLPVERGGVSYPLHLAEVTEAITVPEHRGNGLYTELAIRLMRHLAGSDINLVYGESNALRVTDRSGQVRQPVLSSVAKLGRTSAIASTEAAGFPARLLEQHVRISMGPQDNRPPHAKNDLLVTYMPRTALISRYGSI